MKNSSSHHAVGYDGSAVFLVDKLLHDAIIARASDIHIEAIRTGLRIRFRIDGLLHDRTRFGSDQAAHIVSRIKICAKLDIAQRRIPQDGKFKITLAKRSIDLRVASFPSCYGEKIVIRILDRTVNRIDLPALGMDTSMRTDFQELISRSHGFFLVTGPTGSGKTTSLYAGLSHLNRPEKNIMTLEDPIEYQIEGITQGQIHPEAGFTFQKGVRGLLRQDPDVAMIGEIRDTQTARIAVEAALSGHLVLSSLHTNDAPSSVMRLLDMGVEPFLVNAALSGVLAQRLARRLCTHCTYQTVPIESERKTLRRLDIQTEQIYKAAGCGMCDNLGYVSRVGIFELLIINQQLRSHIIQSPMYDQWHAACCSAGMKTLLHDGAQKVIDGTISLDELLRVVC